MDSGFGPEPSQPTPVEERLDTVAWDNLNCSRAEMRAAEAALNRSDYTQSRHLLLFCVSDNASIGQKVLANLYNVLVRTVFGTVLAFALGLLFDIAYLQTADYSTAVVAGVGLLIAMPMLTFLALLRKGRRSKFTVKAFECVFYLLFLSATWWSAQSSFAVRTRFAFRSRLYDMVNDEFFQSVDEDIPL